MVGWLLMPGPVVREIQPHMSTTRFPIRTPSRQGERCRSRHVPLQQTLALQVHQFNSMIRRYIAWRNRHKDNEALRDISMRAKVA